MHILFYSYFATKSSRPRYEKGNSALFTLHFKVVGRRQEKPTIDIGACVSDACSSKDIKGILKAGKINRLRFFFAAYISLPRPNSLFSIK